MVFNVLQDTDPARAGHASDAGAYALTPNTVELIATLGALFPRGGPVQDPVLTSAGYTHFLALCPGVCSIPSLETSRISGGKYSGNA